MRAAVLLLLAVSSCGYTPPPRTDTGAPRYEADLQACQDASATAVNTRNAKTGLRWFASPVTRWGDIGDQTSACMADKGWGRTRACTADELRNPDARNKLVTREGVRCFDPSTPLAARPAGTSPPAIGAPAKAVAKPRP